MSKKSELDYSKLEAIVKKEAQVKNKFASNKIAIKDIKKTQLVKIAFDVYSVENDPYDSLWKLESFEDGDYLVRLDEIENQTVKTASKKEWTADSNESGTSVTLFYKGIPIHRLAGSIFGFNSSDVGIFKKALLEKVSNDNNFQRHIVALQSDEKKKELINNFPELSGLITNKD